MLKKRVSQEPLPQTRIRSSITNYYKVSDFLMMKTSLHVMWPVHCESAGPGLTCALLAAWLPEHSGHTSVRLSHDFVTQSMFYTVQQMSFSVNAGDTYLDPRRPEWPLRGRGGWASVLGSCWDLSGVRRAAQMSAACMSLCSGSGSGYDCLWLPEPGVPEVGPASGLWVELEPEVGETTLYQQEYKGWNHVSPCLVLFLCIYK